MRIYLDHQATTPLDPRVLEAMLPHFGAAFGNASSSSHAFGWEAAEAVKRARGAVARALGTTPDTVVFTSGATEAINLALKGVAEQAVRGGHMVTLATEHAATLDTMAWLEQRGWRVTYLPVSRLGLVTPEQLAAALEPDTRLVSVLHGNNEVGVVQDVAALGRVARARGVLFHVDAAQTFGKLTIDVEAMNIDLLSLSAHKLHGPKGVGALYVRRRTPLAAQQHGGGHERGLRSGTLNVPGIVGLGAAAAIALDQQAEEGARISALRDHLAERLAALRGVSFNGGPRRLPGNLSVTFELAEAAPLMARLPGLAVSGGAACSSASLEPSHVLRALGLTPAQARSTLRFGLGRFTTRQEVDEAADMVVAAVTALREASPLYPLWLEGLDLSAL